MKGSRCLQVVLTAATIVALIPIAVSGQTRSTTSSGSTPARTAWGDPDLQDIWDFRTITPMERPSQFVGKQVLTDEEAASFEQEENRRLNRDLIDPEQGGLNYLPQSQGVSCHTTNSGTTGERRWSKINARHCS